MGHPLVLDGVAVVAQPPMPMAPLSLKKDRAATSGLRVSPANLASPVNA